MAERLSQIEERIDSVGQLSSVVAAIRGIAAARLLQDGCSPILVTGPRLDALEPLFRHAAALLPEGSPGWLKAQDIITVAERLNRKR